MNRLHTNSPVVFNTRIIWQFAAVATATAVCSALAVAPWFYVASTNSLHAEARRPPVIDMVCGVVLTDPMAPKGEHHKPLQMVVDFPGIKDPKLISLGATKLTDTEIVIGVAIEGEAYAFARRALLGPSQHIVNFVINSTPVSVTYCDLVDCARVLTKQDNNDLIDLHVGGLDCHNQMVFLLNGIRYGQSSEAIPLEDLPFEKTTLGDWKARHPKTMVYEG